MISHDLKDGFTFIIVVIRIQPPDKCFLLGREKNEKKDYTQKRWEDHWLEHGPAPAVVNWCKHIRWSRLLPRG